MKQDANIIVVGGHGRKGEKKDETVLGTSVQFLSLDQRFPCLIVKDRKPRTEKPDGCLRYGVCFDSSEKAKKTLDIVLRMMCKTDKLLSMTVKGERNSMTDDMIKHYVVNEANKKGITKVEVIILETEKDKRNHQVLTDFVHENASDVNKHGYVDFIAVGNVGMNFSSRQSEKYVGSVANAMIRMKKLNVIFVS